LELKPRNDLSNFFDDRSGVIAAEPWIKVKVEVIQSYLQAFVMNVSAHADEVVFVDLFSGSGLYSLGYTKQIFPGPSLSALSSDLPISQWILCERDPEAFKLLERRVQKHFRHQNVFVLDNALSQLPDKFRSIISPAKRGYSVAVCCLIDPFSFELPMSTIDKLAALGFTFLIPFTFPLNERFDFNHYLRERPDQLLRYLGIHNFERLAGVHNNHQFYKRIVRMYENRMLVMGLNAALSAHKVDSGFLEVPAYYMGLFSRRFSTKSIQQDVDLGGQLQISLDA
jgi:three-Cys-motif partner protein